MTRAVSIRGLLVSLVTLGAFALSGVFGCGQAEHEPAHASSQLHGAPKMVPREQFLKAAKSICRRANDERGEKGSALLERRAEETGESLGAVGELELVQKVITPSLRKEIDQLEGIGLPREHAYEAEALWQTLRIVQHEVEVEGIYAWRSAELLRPFRNRAKVFGLDSCVVN
jgi:hypothetical protein